MKKPLKRVGFLVGAAIAAAMLGAPAVVSAQTLNAALAEAYAVNPTLNADRASLRATDEGVPLALSAYRPTIIASGDIAFNYSRVEGLGGTAETRTFPRGVQIQLTQNLFRGFRTVNSVKAAESLVLAGRAALSNSEQNVLVQAAEAYMNVIRDSAIVGIRAQNVEFLDEQLRAAEDRFEVGEGTRTDVAQARSRLQSAISELNLAQSNVNTSRAVYRQIIGSEPRRLSAAPPLTVQLPNTLQAALARALKDHPAIVASIHTIDAAALEVKIIEGELLPTVSLEASAQRRFEPSNTVDIADSAQILGRVTVPIYQAGSVSARVRQAKQTLGQRRIELDGSRDQVRAAVISAWGALDASRAQTVAARAQISAAQLALEGVIEEQRVGQRTTLDVLDAQQELLTAREALITAERNTVVASYSLLSAIGDLSAQRLGLAVRVYQPEENYRNVRDQWFGLRTPDGR